MVDSYVVVVAVAAEGMHECMRMGGGGSTARGETRASFHCLICQMMASGFGVQPSPPGWGWRYAAWPQLLVVLECVWDGVIGSSGWYV